MVRPRECVMLHFFFLVRRVNETKLFHEINVEL